MTHYATESASHAWRKARQVASSHGKHLHAHTLNDGEQEAMGDDVVCVTRQKLRIESYNENDEPSGIFRWATWYCVKSQ